MAPSTVRTIPPWVVQRPPQTLLPLHNSTPSDPRRGRGAPGDGSHHDISPRSSNSDGSGIPNQDHGLGNGDGSGGDKLSAGEGAAGAVSATNQPPSARTSSTTKTTASPTTPPPPESPANPYVPTEPPPSGWNLDLSTLFRRKEGRKWDYLRSAEPVIVPQFHVVNRPWATARDEESNLPRRGGADAGGGSRRPENGSHLGADGAGEHSQQSWWYNPGTQWHSFIESTRYPHQPHEKSEIVREGEMPNDFGYQFFLNPRPGLGASNPLDHQHSLGRLLRRGNGGGGGSSGGYGSGSDLRDGSGNEKSKFLYQRVWRTLLHHPLGPLACRLTVLSTSIVALAVAVTIFRNEHLGALDRGSNYLSRISRVAALDLLQERAQIIVAIVVDVVAVPYIGYITVDDYTGKPLGLRPPQDRIRLILLDLFFIILKSASTALGFEAMIYFVSDDGGNSDAGLMRTLAAFELMGLVSWAMTLTINIFREIERLAGR